MTDPSDTLRNAALDYLTNNFIPVNGKIKRIGWWLVIGGLVGAVIGFFILKAKADNPGPINSTGDESDSENNSAGAK